MRIDQLLVRRGLATTRSQAQRLIASGVSWRSADGWKRVAKSGDEVADDAEIQLMDAAEARYVSRGGLKLDGALERTAVSAEGAVCLDLGQSTGGFTDCLLQRGALHVVGVDVGSGQLHAQLRADHRVTCLEHVNARHLAAEDLRPAFVSLAPGVASEPAFDLVVGDLAFISQTLVLPAVVPLLKAGADVVMLVKPQFELQPGQLGKGGIVNDPSLYLVVEQRIRTAHAALGLVVQAFFESPIQGGDGNREFFIHSIRQQECRP